MTALRRAEQCPVPLFLKALSAQRTPRISCRDAGHLPAGLQLLPWCKMEQILCRGQAAAAGQHLGPPVFAPVNRRICQPSRWLRGEHPAVWPHLVFPCCVCQTSSSAEACGPVKWEVRGECGWWRVRAQETRRGVSGLSQPSSAPASWCAGARRSSDGSTLRPTDRCSGVSYLLQGTEASW